VLLHANVTDGCVWEITYLACGKNSYEIEYGFSTHGGWESGPWAHSNRWTIDPAVLRGKTARRSEIEQAALNAIEAYEKDDLSGFLVLPWAVYDFGPLNKISVPDELKEEFKRLDKPESATDLPV
ncbi:MAG: hypothetical protein II155_04990, partial [Clostridia bacterium]|nr:hypothetical protein [Clostridia bacterium]